MKKLTAGIFATILGLTAVDAFAETAGTPVTVASTNYVQGAIQSLDSAAAATEGKYISGVTMEDGKIKEIVEKDLPTFTDTNTEYTAGDFIKIDENNVITTTYTAGANIEISDTGEISATDTNTEYTAGDFVKIEKNEKGENVITTTYTAGTNVEISDTGVISATDTNTEYTAGDGITISADNKISSDIEFSTGLSSKTDANGKITVTADTTSLQNAINMTEETADEGTAIKAVEVKDGKLVVTSTEKLFTKDDVDGGTADAGKNYLLQSVKLENGELSVVNKIEIVDTYPTQAQ